MVSAVVSAVVVSGSLLSVTAPATAASPPSGPSSSAGPPATVSWSACSDPAYRCASVTVPVDYRRAGGPTMRLALIEHPATGPGPDLGPLVFNPGGPGESGVQILPVLEALVPPAISEHFDLVSFDERGTGASEALRCGPPPSVVTSIDPVNEHRGGLLPATAVFSGLAAACARRYPGLVPFVDSTSAARDLDRIRAALGVRQISYWGLSYGTVLGSVYARLFPDRVRAMILDGAVVGSDPLARQAVEEAPAIVAALDHFFATCRAEPACPLGPDPAAFYRRLADRLSAHPLGAPGGSDTVPVTVGDLYTATLFALSVPAFAANFPQALVSAADGDGSGLRGLALDLEEDLDGSSLVGPEWTITCNDAASAPGPAAAGRLARSLAGRDGAIGAFAVTYLAAGCVDWPAPPDPVTALAVHGAPTLLVLGNTGDPNTPYVAARRLTRALGRARLLTWRGWGHTWLLNGHDDPCMVAAVSAYLLDGRVPPAGTTCR